MTKYGKHIITNRLLLKIVKTKRLLVQVVNNTIVRKIIGNRKKLSKKLQKILKDSEKKTQNNKKLQINLALNYGSKDEILNSVNKLIKVKKKITEKNIEQNLYTKNIPNHFICL